MLNNEYRRLSPDGALEAVLCEDDGRTGGWETEDKEGSSNTWSVFLSLVTASLDEEGDIASENIAALSIPLRSSLIIRDVAVE